MTTDFSQQTTIGQIQSVSLKGISAHPINIGETMQSKVKTLQGRNPLMTQEKHRILLVEDEHHVRDIAKIVLELEGFEVIEAENGRKALDVLEKDTPDLIITDIMMPEMDGVEFFLTLKESDRTSSLPVIVLTVKSQFEDIKYASLLGMDEYMTKPFDPRDLVKRVRKLLKDK